MASAGRQKIGGLNVCVQWTLFMLHLITTHTHTQKNRLIFAYLTLSIFSSLFLSVHPIFNVSLFRVIDSVSLCLFLTVIDWGIHWDNSSTSHSSFQLYDLIAIQAFLCSTPSLNIYQQIWLLALVDVSLHVICLSIASIVIYFFPIFSNTGFYS